MWGIGTQKYDIVRDLGIASRNFMRHTLIGKNHIAVAIPNNVSCYEYYIKKLLIVFTMYSKQVTRINSMEVEGAVR